MKPYFLKIKKIKQKRNIRPGVVVLIIFAIIYGWPLILGYLIKLTEISTA